MARLSEKTAAIEEANLDRLLKTDEVSAGRIRAVGKSGGQADAGGLLSRSGDLTNRQVIDQSMGLPRTLETVDYYANRSGVDFRGARVEIVEGADDIVYLDFQRAVARTDDLGVQLGPAALQDEEPSCVHSGTKVFTCSSIRPDGYRP